MRMISWRSILEALHSVKNCTFCGWPLSRFEIANMQFFRSERRSIGVMICDWRRCSRYASVGETVTVDDCFYAPSSVAFFWPTGLLLDECMEARRLSGFERRLNMIGTRACRIRMLRPELTNLKFSEM